MTEKKSKLIRCRGLVIILKIGKIIKILSFEGTKFIIKYTDYLSNLIIKGSVKNLKSIYNLEAMDAKVKIAICYLLNVNQNSEMI